MLKANAYGLGVDSIATSLKQAGVKEFFVATAEEGMELRSLLGSTATIFVLSGYDRNESSAYALANLIPCLNNTRSMEHYWKDFSLSPYAIHVETGLNRLAMQPNELLINIKKLVARPPCLVMSHLACSDVFESSANELQLNQFNRFRNTSGLSSSVYSIAASHGIYLGDAYHGELVRPGIALYCALDKPELRDAIEIFAQTLSVSNLKAGDEIGYGLTWKASKETTVATLAIGYSDGLPRVYDGVINFYASGKPYPVIGRISMDLVNVDITGLEKVPSYFELLGKNQTISSLAISSGQIPNSLLTSFGSSMCHQHI